VTTKAQQRTRRGTGHPGLDRAAARAARWAPSEARARQVWWVAGELARALAHQDFPLAPDAPVEDLFDEEPIAAYLALGARGELRARASARPASTDRSEQVRRGVVALLAEACGGEARLPGPGPRPATKPVVPARPRETWRAVLADLQQRELGGESVARLRMLAIGGMVADTGARAGELVGQALDDLHPQLAAARVRRFPQGSQRGGPARVETVRLLPATSAALAAWLTQRQDLIAPRRPRTGGAAPLQGSAGALWVSIRSNHGARNGATGATAARPAGTPLLAHGLGLAWSAAVAQVNELLAGEPGWEPLPGRMERLRRGVTPVPFGDCPPPLTPRPARVAELLDQVAHAGRDAAALLTDPAGHSGVDDVDGGRPLEAQTRRSWEALRRAQDAAWLEGASHAQVLAALAGAGLWGAPLVRAGGWHPALLDALELAARYGRQDLRRARPHRRQQPPQAGAAGGEPAAAATR
jgi:integrase